MSQSRILDPASTLLPQNVAHRANVSAVGSCRKCRCREGALASWRRSEMEMGTPDLKDREDHIEVKQANHDNGLLQIDVDRKIGKR